MQSLYSNYIFSKNKIKKYLLQTTSILQTKTNWLIGIIFMQLLIVGFLAWKSPSSYPNIHQPPTEFSTTLSSKVAVDNLSLGNNIIFGAKTLKGASLKNFTGYGDIAIYDSNIQGNAVVYGDLQTNNLTVNHAVIYGIAQIHDTDIKKSLALYGEAHIIHSIIKGNSIIHGNLEANHAVFSSDMLLNSNRVNLLHTKTKNITIARAQNKEQQVIKISGKSIINGDIIFESGKGNLQLDDHVVIKGEIKGAKVSRGKG